MDDKEKRFIDELLDASLRRYASAEPRPGLEDRVLAGVRSRQQSERRRTVWAWAIGTAAAAAMVTLLVIYWPRQQPAPLPVIAKAPANLSAPKVAAVAPLVQPPMQHRSQRHATPRWVDTRPQQFPTPRPLSEQEKLLVAYVQALRGSAATPAANTKPDVEPGQAIPPLSIAAIKIEPLAPEEDGDGK